MKLSELIRLKRKEKKLTLIKCSELSGVSYSKLVRIELGQSISPTPLDLRLLANTLEIDYARLLTYLEYEGDSEDSQAYLKLNTVDVFTLSSYKKRLFEKQKDNILKTIQTPFEDVADLKGIYVDEKMPIFHEGDELIIDTNPEYEEQKYYLIINKKIGRYFQY